MLTERDTFLRVHLMLCASGDVGVESFYRAVRADVGLEHGECVAFPLDPHVLDSTVAQCENTEFTVKVGIGIEIVGDEGDTVGLPGKGDFGDLLLVVFVEQVLHILSFLRGYTAPPGVVELVDEPDREAAIWIDRDSSIIAVVRATLIKARPRLQGETAISTLAPEMLDKVVDCL